MAELILEIGCEELPAGFIRPAEEQLSASLAAALDAAGLTHGPLEIYGTPRRLGLVIRELAESQPDREERVTGPKLDFCYDANGAPTKALLGFAKTNGVEIADLGEVDGPKGRAVLAVKQLKGKPTAELLPEMLRTLVAKLAFRKSMRWAGHDESFARPVHYLVALFDGAVVPFSFAGVTSGTTSVGHRFMAPKPIEVRHIESYLAHLRQAYVMWDVAERERVIREEAQRLAREAGGKALLDDALVSEVANLVEFPVPILGHLDTRFLSVPKEILITTMMKNQRYFPVLDANGELMPFFITFANTQPEDPAVVAGGNERVLKARLSDARFFFEEDRKRTLESFTEGLAHVTFEERLGTLAEKVARVAAQVRFLAPYAGLDAAAQAEAERAVALCKADLVCGVVYEFPELQGVMGRLYAEKDGEPAAVCAAIEQHYWPRFAEDALPEQPIAAAVALADKLDTLVGCFGVGLIPSGTADPYALRRQALGILRILVARGWRVPLSAWLAFSAETLAAKLKRPAAEVVTDVQRFLEGRYRAWVAKDHRADVLDAVLAAGFDILPEVEGKRLALDAFAAHPDFKNLAAAFKRVMNILKAPVTGTIDPARFESPAEGALWNAVEGMRADVARQVAGGEYRGAMERLSGLRAPVDAFFAEVLVMAPDEAVRRNRLVLLDTLAELFRSLADFRKIQTDD